MAESEESPASNSSEKLEKARTPQVHERSVSISVGETRIITIQQPSLSHAIGVSLRDWLKTRIKSLRENLSSDVRFCGQAFRVTFAEGWWRKVIAALSHLHKAVNAVVGTTLLAFLLGLYVVYIYPVVGKPGTAIIGLSLLVFCLLVTIRATRKLYEKVAATSFESQSQIEGLTGAIETLKSELASATERLGDLQERLEPHFGIRFEPYTYPFMQYFKRSDITQYRVGVQSPVAVRDAEVVVNGVRVNDTTHYDVHLRPMHDRVEGGTKRVKLSPFKEAAWDIASEHPGVVVLNCISALGPMDFDDGDHEFELMVTGGDSLPATKLVKMEIRERRIVSFNLEEGRLSDLAS